MDKGFRGRYSKGLKVVFSLKGVKEPVLEYAFGVAIAVGVSVGLSVSVSPLWLLLTIPVGVFLALHGIWRWRF